MRGSRTFPAHPRCPRPPHAPASESFETPLPHLSPSPGAGRKLPSWGVLTAPSEAGEPPTNCAGRIGGASSHPTPVGAPRDRRRSPRQARRRAGLRGVLPRQPAAPCFRGSRWGPLPLPGRGRLIHLSTGRAHRRVLVTGFTVNAQKHQKGGASGWERAEAEVRLLARSGKWARGSGLRTRAGRPTHTRHPSFTRPCDTLGCAKAAPHPPAPSRTFLHAAPRAPRVPGWGTRSTS